MKSLSSDLMSLLLLFSIVYSLYSCSESSNPTDSQEQIKMFFKATLYCESTIDGETLSVEADGIGTTLNNSRGVYYLIVQWGDSTSPKIKIKDGITTTISNPNILSFENNYAKGLSVGETEIILSYPKDRNYEGFSFETKGWTYQYSVSGFWAKYQSGDSVNWGFSEFIPFYDIPEQKGFTSYLENYVSYPDYTHYKYLSIDSNTFTRYDIINGKIENENLITTFSPSTQKYYKYLKQ